MSDLVSIIIPVYNGEKYIKKCINSIICQSYSNIEIIIVNDGSTDGTMIELNKIQDDRVRLFDIDNGGVSNARNVGLQNARGKYIMFVDADDYLASSTISILYNTIKSTSVDIIRFNGYIEKHDKKLKELEFPIKNKTILDTSENNDLVELIEILNHPQKSVRCYCCLLFIKKQNIIPFNSNLTYLEDKVFYLENLTNNKKILFLDEPLYYYVFNKNSKTKSIEKFYSNILDILDAKDVEKGLMIKKKFNFFDILNASYGSLILYRLDYFILNCTYTQFKNLIIKINSNDRIKASLIFDKKYLSKFKKVQYMLINCRMYMLYYVLTKIKNKLKR